MPRKISAFAALLVLPACGGPAEETAPVSGESVAEKLEGAADQSGPAAKQVLESAAAEARQHPTMVPPGEPGSFVQDTMERAGKAESATLPSGSPTSSGER